MAQNGLRFSKRHAESMQHALLEHHCWEAELVVSDLLLSQGQTLGGRYWLAESYAARHAAGQEPQSIDKEFLRLWFRANCDPYGDAARLGCHCRPLVMSVMIHCSLALQNVLLHQAIMICQEPHLSTFVK